MDELSPTDSGYGNTIGIGSNAITQAADNSGNVYIPQSNLSTVSTPDLRYLINESYEPVGNTSNNYVMPGAYTGTGLTNTYENPSALLNTVKGLFTDKNGNLNLQALGAVGGGLAGLLGAMNAKTTPTGYQGGIPLMGASRTMLTAPPTTNPDGSPRRPGQNGINYGGDVTYSRMATGTDPWANLSGTNNSGLTGIGGIAGGTKTVVPGGTTLKPPPDNKPGGDVKKFDTVNLGSTGYQAAIAAGLTPAQYLNNINQWILDNPRASKTQIDDAMKKFGVSQEDLQEALRTTTFSDATKYGLTHGMGLQEMNQNVEKWLRDNPYATNAQIQTAMKKVGMNDEDVARAMNGLNSSRAKEYAVVHDMGLDKLYQNILDYQAANHTAKEIADAMAASGVEQRDIDAANRYAAETKYVANPKSDAGGGDQTKEIYDYFASPATQAALASGDLRSVASVMDAKGYTPAEVAAATGTPLADVQAAYASTKKMAAGGEIAMAKGRYLQGQTDGMADKLPAQIGADQPAALSHGEFVIPADVVSHMGNGNSDAGAKKLYQMMDKIRMARTGTKKQGKKINPDKFMPGGLASSKYAAGGSVKKFQTGGATGVGSAISAGATGTESNLSNWVGPYVGGMLGQGQALANLPYQAYTGPLTAGASPLQTGAFQTATGLATPTSIGAAAGTAGDIATKAQGLSYTPGTTSFDATQAQTYMNPYLESALKPQLDEARRQSQITQQQNAAKMTQAGAFGGSRQAILDAETQRNLANTQANITGTGYSTAYDKAMAQFNADQARKAQEAQFSATYGLQGLQTGLQGAQAQGQLGLQQNQAGLANLAAQMEAGNVQRGIESEGIAADKAQFEEARSNPYKMVQFQQSLLQGLPLAAQSYNVAQPSTLQQILSGAGGVAGMLPSTSNTSFTDLQAALKKLGIG